MFCQYKNAPLSSSTDYVCPQLCNRLDIVGVQGWWCNLVLFPAGSQTSEADRKSKRDSDKPCEDGVRSHSRCSQSHFPSGLFETRNEGCSPRRHVYLRWNCGDTISALNSATRYFSCNKCVSFLCSVNVSSRKALFWFTSGFVSPFTAVKLEKKKKFIFVASLVHFSLTWALIKLSLGMYTWQHDAFWMIICCQDIVLDIEMQITYS